MRALNLTPYSHYGPSFFGEVCGSIYILWMLGEIYHSGIDLININATPMKRVDEWLNNFSLGSAD